MQIINSGLSKTLNSEIKELCRPALTDIGNACRFATAFSETVRYVPARGWFLFSQTHWQRADTDTMLSLARQSLDELLNESSQLPDEETELRERILKHLARCESLPRLSALLRLARTLPGMQLAYTALDSDPYLLNMRNGTLDLRSGELLPHDPQHYLTRLLPYDYDPAASAPAWDLFLDRLTGSDPDLQHYLQRAIGSTLFGASNESTCFVLTGTGQRAHQLFLSILRQLLGSHSTHALSLQPRTLSPTLLTSRLLTLTPSALGRGCNPALLSAFLNHDPLSSTPSNLLYQPHSTLWLSMPELSQLSPELAFLREYLQPIPLSLTLSSYEATQISTELQQALPAILNWAIHGFQLWYTEAPPVEPTCIQQAAIVFQEDQDPLALFLAQSSTSEPDSAISAHEFYRAYVTWARASGERILSASRFSALALASGLRRSQHGSGRFYQGLKLLPPTTNSSSQPGVDIQLEPPDQSTAV